MVIVGGGPAGLATALHLAERAPDLAAETVILEKNAHPRPKLCGGGITFHGEQQLARLGLDLDVPAVTVHRLEFRLGEQTFTVRSPSAMRIIQRAEFDAALAEAVRERGIAVRGGEQLLDLKEGEGGYLLTTNRGLYRARVVVAADGANSIVRRKLGIFTSVGVARLLRVLTPVDPQSDLLWRGQTAVFDFSCVIQGVQGYVWDFPCLVDGAAYMNRGIMDSRIAPHLNGHHPRGHLKHTFDRSLAARQANLEGVPLEGHPVRWFNADGEFARPHVLFVGDAAGVDPLFAEGISYAIEYGAVAAQMIAESFRRGDFSFGEYRARLMRHDLGRMLRRRVAVARAIYSYRRPRLWSLLWRLADVAPTRLQRVFAASLGLLPL